MNILAVRRRAQLSEQDKQDGVLSGVYSNEQLPEMVSKCDYIVMATPFTEQTHKLFSKDAIAAMQPHAVFVNIGRGKCVDEEALVAALQQGAQLAACIIGNCGSAPRRQLPLHTMRCVHHHLKASQLADEHAVRRQPSNMHAPFSTLLASGDQRF